MPKKKSPRPRARPRGEEYSAALAARFKPLFDALPEVAYLKDRAGRNLEFNAAFLRLIGRERSETLGKTDAELFPPELARACRKSDAAVLRRGKAARVLESAVVGGQPRLFDTVKAPLRDGRRIVGLIGISRDITALRRTEEALRRSEEHLRRVLSGAPVILFAVDSAGVFTLSEGRALAKLGLAPGQVVGRSAFELYGHNAKITASLRRALAGESFSEELWESGTVWETHYAPQRDRNGRITGMIGVAIDVSERADGERERRERLAREEALRARAESAARAKDEFLAVLSHELRTPMTAMLGWTWVLRSRGLRPQDHQAALAAIERNMKAQAQIIEDILDVSQIATGKMRVATKPVELDAVVETALAIVGPAAEARGIRIERQAADRPLVVRADAERLQQAVWNLLINAVKFTGAGGRVLVRLLRENGNAALEVADTGVGIRAESLPHIFDPFTLGEDSLTREHGGIGLGLAISRHIIELHGGTLRAESAGPGQGSRFILSLPVSSAPPARPAAGPAARLLRRARGELPDLSGLRVLVVEDEADTRELVRALLEHCGASVALAASAEAGFASLQRSVPNALLCDLDLPGEDGYSLLKRIRALPPGQGGDLPAAAMTGSTRGAERARVLMAGFQMFLPKPVEPAELAAVVLSLAHTKTA